VSTPRQHFVAFSQLLHWMMAAMVLTMLGIGVAMVVSLADYHVLLSIHRPLGIAILLLVVVRFVNRLFNPPPPFPATMPPIERFAAMASEYTMYALMFVLPLVGWGMLSAASYPIVLFGPVGLPPILPHDLAVYAVLRKLHTILAYLFFLIIIGHFGAVLFHTLIVRDGLLGRMAPWIVRPSGTLAAAKVETAQEQNLITVGGKGAEVNGGGPRISDR
jgi:cytochrome b561